jgi:hypothetical protein
MPARPIGRGATESPQIFKALRLAYYPIEVIQCLNSQRQWRARARDYRLAVVTASFKFGTERATITSHSA